MGKAQAPHLFLCTDRQEQTHTKQAAGGRLRSAALAWGWDGRALPAVGLTLTSQADWEAS